MNWYKWAQKKTLEEMLSGLEYNPAVSKETISWLKTLPKEQMGPAMNVIMKNPKATMDDIMRVFKKEEPLTKDQEELIAFYPLIGDWMKGILLNVKGAKRKQVFELLKENAARIRDWTDRTRANLKGRTLQNAIQETEKWHEEEAAVGKGEYAPTRPEDIIIKYPNGYNWQRISRGVDARIEGNKMNHCVGSYCHDVENEKINVYSLRDKNNNPLITAGFKYDNAIVVQMKGKDDSNPVHIAYKKYIEDILKKLGTRYNDGEDYLDKYTVYLDNYTAHLDKEKNSSKILLKSFSKVNQTDFENDPILQKMVHNVAIKGEDEHGQIGTYISSKVTSGNAPKEWIDSINKKILTDGIPPNWASHWARIKLENGKAPKEWIDGITSKIASTGEVEDWAWDWVSDAMTEGRGMPEWRDSILNNLYDNVDQGKYRWGEDWIIAVLDDRINDPEAKKLIISYINKTIDKNELVKGFAVVWVHKQIVSGNAPEFWVEKINEMLTKSEGLAVPRWSMEGLGKLASLGAIPEEILFKILEGQLKIRSLSAWATAYDPQSYIAQKLGGYYSGTTLIYHNVMHRLEHNGYPAVEKWINEIPIRHKDISSIDSFIQGFIEEKFDNGNPPEAWANMVDKRIADGTFPPEYAMQWVNNTFSSGKAPDHWFAAINDVMNNGERIPPWMGTGLLIAVKNKKLNEKGIDRISESVLHQTEQELKHSGSISLPYRSLEYPLTEDLARELMNSGQGTEKMKEISNNMIIRIGRPPVWAYDWAKEQLKNDNFPEWKKILDKMIDPSGKNFVSYCPEWAFDWAQELFESGNAPKGWYERNSKAIINTGMPMMIGHEWSRNIINANKAPDEWWYAIEKYKEETGTIPAWAKEAWF